MFRVTRVMGDPRSRARRTCACRGDPSGGEVPQPMRMFDSSVQLTPATPAFDSPHLDGRILDRPCSFRIRFLTHLRE